MKKRLTIGLTLAVMLLGVTIISACGGGSSSLCGNGVVDTGETCDKGITSGTGACPTSCDDDDLCTTDTLENANTCTAACQNAAVTTAIDNDLCCPAGANLSTDNDCLAFCGNGVLEAGEDCDTAITSGADACSTTCDDSNSGTLDKLLSPGTCRAECAHPTCGGDTADSTCPVGCTYASGDFYDVDCATPVDISGTWVAKIDTPGTMTMGAIQPQSVNITLIASIHIAGGNAELKLCNLRQRTTPDPKTMVMTFPQIALNTMHTSGSISGTNVQVGNTVALPDFLIRTGIDSSNAQVDSDSDGQEGITVPGAYGSVMTFKSHIGLNISLGTFSAVLQDANTMVGTAIQTTTGKVFSFDNPALAQYGNAAFSVTPTNTTLSVSFAHHAGNLDCAAVLALFE